jgi:hypothetical protein
MEATTVFLGVWNLLVSAFLGLAMMNIKSYSDEQKRLNILLNKTREEIARDNVTKDEVNRITQHIDDRFNKLEEKIDRLIQRG